MHEMRRFRPKKITTTLDFLIFEKLKILKELQKLHCYKANVLGFALGTVTFTESAAETIFVKKLDFLTSWPSGFVRETIFKRVSAPHPPVNPKAVRKLLRIVSEKVSKS